MRAATHSFQGLNVLRRLASPQVRFMTDRPATMAVSLPVIAAVVVMRRRFVPGIALAGIRG